MPYNVSAKVPSLMGQRFTRLLVVGVSAAINRNRAYVCKCDCGTVKTIRYSELTRGKTKSCGCLQRDQRTGGAMKGIKRT